MAEPPAAFEWDKVMGIDPFSLQGWKKHQLDDVFKTVVLVTLHFSYHKLHQYVLSFKCFEDNDISHQSVFFRSG